MSSASPNTRTKVAYITGLSHSGSTLLDLILNAHSEMISVGELKQLTRKLSVTNSPKKKYKQCSCGAPSLLECPFWAAVNRHLQTVTGLGLADLNVTNYKETVTFQRDNLNLYNAVLAVSGKSAIVDSSKNITRLKLLMDNPNIDIFPLHIIREPKGQVCSMLRKNTGTIKHIARYVKTTRLIRATLKNKPHSTVQYEELVRCPREVLEPVLAQLGLDFEVGQLSWASQPKHHVGGNRIRRRLDSTIRLDESWRNKLSILQKVAIDIGTVGVRAFH